MSIAEGAQSPAASSRVAGVKRKRVPGSGGTQAQALAQTGSGKGKGKGRATKMGKGKGKGRDEVGASSSTGSLATKLHHSVALVSRAAKKARTFEIQKLVRKLKPANADDASGKGKGKASVPDAAALAELEAILAALKELDADALAGQALRNKLGKEKRSGLADNDEVRTFLASLHSQEGAGAAAVGGAGAAEATSPKGKAQNRILAHKVIVECMTDVLASLRARASSSQDAKTAAGGQSQDKQKRKRALEADAGSDVNSESGREASAADGSTSDDTTSTSEESEEDSDDDGTVSHISAEDEMPGPEDDFFGFDNDAAAAKSSRTTSRRRRDGDSDERDSDSDDSASSFPLARATSSPPPASAKAKAKATKEAKASKKDKTKSKKVDTASAKPVTSSAFLPSLAGGYTVGDEDGSVYDFSDDDGTAPAAMMRKNRRGQRARQAIWERKYGKNAKHVVKQKEREAGTELNREKTKAERQIEALKKSGRYIYGVDSNLTGPAEGKQARVWAAAAPAAAAGATPVASAPTPASEAAMRAIKKQKAAEEFETKEFHPSWEARRKLKEAQASVANAKPAGKKIKFD